MKIPILDTAARRRLRQGALLAVLSLGAAACDLDLIDPNAPSEEEVLASPELLLVTAVGIQAQYADNVNIFVRAPALVTDEWGTRPLALPADISLVTGTADPTFGVVSDPFAAAYRLARTADLLVANAPRANLGVGLQTGIVAMSKLLKAMALGNLTTQFERLPANFDPEGAVPLPREQVRDTVIAILESARADIATVTDAELAPFVTRVTGSPGLNVRATIDAMLARYYLFDGQYALANAAALRVSRSTVSQFTYPGNAQNPIWAYGFSVRYVGTRRSVFTEADPADRRPAFWATRSAATGQVGNPDSVFDFRMYGGRNDPYFAYMPDEMLLIQAEVAARGGNLAGARELINLVRTQGLNTTTGVCTTSTTEPTPCLPALPVEALDTEAEVFAQILYERRYELYAQGVRWEDLRRLQAYTPKRPSMPFLPFPQSECARNPNAGCNS